MKGFCIFIALVILILLVSFVPSPAATHPFSSSPSYDSGWRPIDHGQTISMWHSLGLPPSLLFVHLEARRYNSGYGIHQVFLGGNDLGSRSSSIGAEEHRLGAYWHNLTTNYISVTRQPEDTLVDAVRVRIWAMSASADYSSNWVAIPAGQSHIFTHNLGGNIDDYVVDLMFNDTDPTVNSLGVNQRAYGGRTLGTLSTFFDDGQRVGAYWYALQGNVIYVYRMPDDEYADQVLVRIWKRQKPTYDSGWVSIGQGLAHIFTHNIGGSPEDYRVDMEFKASAPWLVNQCFYGGNDVGPKSTFPSALDNDRVGAYWYGLDNDSIIVVRRTEDTCAPQVRIRIWNFWTPTRPDSDSGWLPVIPDHFAGFNPGITGSFDPYLVDLQFKDSGLFSIGIHQRSLGGMDWTDGSRIGASWYYSNGIILFTRRTEDTDAPYIRARLWKMPKPAYDSGWQLFTTPYTLQLDHNLGGNPADYLVDVQFKDSAGFSHQAGYGGYDVTHIGAGLGDRKGAFWDGLDDTHIEVRRQPEETNINQARVRIWTMARPDYDSGMATTMTGTTTFTHNLGGNPENYFINLVFNNTSGPKLLNQMYYGGAVLSSQAVPPHVAGDPVGGFWRDLRSTNVDFFRHFQDTWIDQARLRIWLIKQQMYLPLLMR